MLKYCFIKNEEIGLVQLGEGCSDEYYEEIGMIKRNVDKSEKDLQWYLYDKCPHYTEEEKTEIRKQEFLKDFFQIDNVLNEKNFYFRKTPKGYSSAIESLNTANNTVSKIGKLPADTLIFYREPDFTKVEECTEEWLVQHQVKNEEMTTVEFDEFYLKFITAWNKTEH